MSQISQKTREWRDVSVSTFRNEIVTQYRPALLKGAVADWPIVREALAAPDAICGALLRYDSGARVSAFIAPPSAKGRFFYRDDMRGMNFEQVQLPFAQAIQRLRSLSRAENPEGFYVGSAPAPDCLPRALPDLRFDLVPPGTPPRLWLGNRTVIAPHFDLSDNIACVVAGRRRFTFFPPDQVENLYVGPLEFTPAGQPCSMVDLKAPDFARYPRFATALEHAEHADLEPGDAIYIPYMWWHHVEAFDAINMLVNYWWNDAGTGGGAGLEALIYAILAIKPIPKERREMWRKFFDHYIFEENGDPAAHLDLSARGILSPMTPGLERFLLSALQKMVAARQRT